MKVRSTGSHYRGSSTLEVLVAFAVVTLSIVAVVGVVFGNQALSVDTTTNTEAMLLSQTGLEAARALAQKDFGSLDPAQPPLVSHDGIYTTTRTVSAVTDSATGQVDPYTKRVVVATAWTDGLRQLENTFSTLVTSLPAALSGDTCQVPLTADWGNPVTVNTTLVNIGTGNTPTAVAVRGTYAYVASAGSKVFTAVDVANPKTPVVKGSLLGSAFKIAEIDSIFIAGNYAYVVGYAHGSYNDQGGTVFVQNGIAYVGTKDSEATQFAVIDIGTDPANPKLVAGSNLLLAAGSAFMVVDARTPTAPRLSYALNYVADQINLIQVYNNRAYVSTESFRVGKAPVLLPSGGQGFTVFDVSSVPNTSPVLIGYYDSGDHGYGMVTRDPAHVLLGGHGGTLVKGLHLLDASGIDSAHPSRVIDHMQLPMASGRLVGIITSGEYAFVSTQDAAAVFAVVGLDTEANTITPLVTRSASDLGATAGSAAKVPASGFDCQKNLFFQAFATSGDALKIIGPGASLTSDVRNAQGESVVGGTVEVGAPVHAYAEVRAGSVPSGTVTFKRYSGSSCTGASVDETRTLVNGAIDATLYVPSTTGSFSYKSIYNGDSTYGALTGTCQAVTSTRFAIAALTPTVAGRDVKVTLTNTGSAATLTKVEVTWPVATNGKLQQVLLGGKVIYDKPDLAVSPATIVALQGSAADQTIGAGVAKELKVHFEKNGALAPYVIRVWFGAQVITITL